MQNNFLDNYFDLILILSYICFVLLFVKFKKYKVVCPLCTNRTNTNTNTATKTKNQTLTQKNIVTRKKQIQKIN